MDKLLLRKVLRAVEGHVLDQVSHPLLIVVFKNRASLDDEPEFRALFGFRVGTDVVAQTVGQFTYRDLRIDGHRLRERGGLSRERRSLRPRTRQE